MDAVEFLRERKRMCKYYDGKCHECPIGIAKEPYNKLCREYLENYPEMAVPIVEEWSKEYPIKTWMTDFLEKYPKAPVDRRGFPRVCAKFLGYTDICTSGCRECWNTPLGDTK